jgi:hypothetical protein
MMPNTGSTVTSACIRGFRPLCRADPHAPLERTGALSAPMPRLVRVERARVEAASLVVQQPRRSST